MAVTLRDIAEACDLSPSTISGILNNRPNTWASAETRQRVWDTARRLRYRPNAAARALRTGKTYTVGFVYHLNDSALTTTFGGASEMIAAVLGDAGYDLLVRVYPNQQQLLDGLEDMVRRQSCDAMVLFGGEPDVAEQGTLLERHQVPFVVKGRHEARFPHWPQVDFDHEEMMRSVVQHFFAHHHRRIAYLGFDGPETYVQHLIAGYTRAMQEFTGQPPDPEWIAATAGSVSANEAQIERWLSLPEQRRPTALAVGGGNAVWLAAQRVLWHRGRQIGDTLPDFAVAGQSSDTLVLALGQGMTFDDILFTRLAQVAVRDLLLPLLQDRQPVPTVRRILPELHPVPSLQLFEACPRAGR